MFDPLLDPAARERDMINLAVQVFLPAAVALVLLLIPRRRPEVLRWVALVGVAATLTLALCRLIDYYTILDSYSDRTTTSLYHPAARLDARSDQQASDAARPVPKPYRSDDLVTRRPWVGRLDIDFALGVDGLNLALVLVTCVVTLGAVVATWYVADGVKPTLILILLVQTGVTGALLSLDLVLYYCFAEALLVPAGALLAAGGRGVSRRFVVAVKAGSAALLVAILMLHSADVRDFVDPGVVAARAAEARQIDPRLDRDATLGTIAVHTFDPVTLGKFGRAVLLVTTGQADRLTVRKSAADLPLPGDDPHAVPLFAPGVDRAAAISRLHAQPAAGRPFQVAVFVLLMFSFTSRMALFPLYGWRAAAHLRLTPSAAMMLAGAVVPLGGYGFIRYAYPLAPLAAYEFTGIIALLGTAATLAGLVLTLRAHSLCGLAAASGLMVAGSVVLGVGSWAKAADDWDAGVAGAVFLLAAHGLGAAGTCFAAGCLTRRFGHADLDILGGLGRTMPRLAVLAAVSFVAGVALPGVGGFIGHLGVLTAALSYCPWLGVPAVGVAVAAVMHRLYLGSRLTLTPGADRRAVPDLDAGEAAGLLLFAVPVVGMGVVPSLVFVWLDPAVQGWVDALARVG